MLAKDLGKAWKCCSFAAGAELGKATAQRGWGHGRHPRLKRHRKAKCISEHGNRSFACRGRKMQLIPNYLGHNMYGNSHI